MAGKEMLVIGKSSAKGEGFELALEWMRYLTEAVSFKQKVRIVVEYDPDKGRTYTEIMLPKGEQGLKDN